MSKFWRIAAALVLIFSAVTSVVIATHASAAVKPTPRVLINNSGQFHRKPTGITLGGRKLTGLRWTTYNQTRGVAHGTVRLHNGTTHSAHIRVAGVKGAEILRYYGTLRLDYNAGGIHEVKFYKVTTNFWWREVAN